MWHTNQYEIDEQYRQDIARRREHERLLDIARQHPYPAPARLSLLVARLSRWITRLLHHRPTINPTPGQTPFTSRHAHR